MLLAFPQRLRAERASRRRGRGERAGRLPTQTPGPLAALMLSTAVRLDNLSGVSTFVVQIFQGSSPPGGLCETVSVYLKHGGNSCDRMFPHYLQRGVKPHTLRHSEPSYSSSGCYLLCLSHT